MSPRSLRFRLLSAGTFFTVLALVLAGFSLLSLFERHLERRFEDEMERDLRQLIGRIETDRNGRIHLTGAPLEPRFAEPLSGLYWQVQDDSKSTLLRSRSLWDNLIALPDDQLSLGDVHSHDLPGPAGQYLMVRERQIIVLPEEPGHRLRIVVARDREDLHAAKHAFAGDMLPYFALLAAFLFIGNWFQVSTGLSPLELVRRGVYAIRGGDAARLDDSYPDEVTPLVDEINELLEARDETVERARAWTADLAHGLKTPLSALGADAQRLREAGQSDIADDLDHLAQSMRRRVDRELIRARLRSAGSVTAMSTNLEQTIDKVLHTLLRTPGVASLRWDVDVPDSINVAMREDDLAELLGNLLDNAGKWAKHRVRVGATGGDSIRLLIEDDGPGVEDRQLQRLGERGLRLDQQVHGHGLGLAIVRDIVDAYEGSIRFSQSDLGGLAVEIQFGDAHSHVSLD